MKSAKKSNRLSFLIRKNRSTEQFRNDGDVNQEVIDSENSPDAQTDEQNVMAQLQEAPVDHRDNNSEIKQEAIASEPSTDTQTIRHDVVTQFSKMPVEQRKNNGEVQPEISGSEKSTDTQMTEQFTSVQFAKSIEEVKKLSRQYYINTSTIQENSAAVKELNENLQQSRGELVEVRKSVEQMLIIQRQENGELKREVKEWEQTAIEFFRLLERALDCEKDENQRSIEKILDEFARTVIVRGLERIIPQSDEPLTEKFHAVIEEKESPYIIPGNILRCASWGYRIGSDVIEKAKVVVAKLPVKSTEIIPPQTDEKTA